jgi:hypothetical protein
MSTLYLIDANTPILANSEINDVRWNPPGSDTLILGGNFVVRLPDGVSIGPTDPTDLTDLLTKKYAGLLASHPMYTNIAYDDFTSTPGVSLANSSRIAFGNRCTTTFIGNPGVFQSAMVTLASTPTQALVVYETAYREDNNPIADRTQRIYVELDPAPYTTCQVSFDNGSTFLTTTNGALLNIPVPNQGSQFIIRITGTLPKLGLDSWAVIY